MSARINSITSASRGKVGPRLFVASKCHAILQRAFDGAFLTVRKSWHCFDGYISYFTSLACFTVLVFSIYLINYFLYH